MKKELIAKFTKDIVPKALSLIPALTDSLPVLILYLFTVLWFTVLNRAETFTILQLELFWSFRKFLAGDTYLGIEIAENVVMFMPFGFLCCDLFYKWESARITSPSAISLSSSTSTVQAKRKSANSRRLDRYGKWLLIPLLALSFSLLIETLQLTMVRGLAEADDLFTNTLGAILGLCSYEVFRKLSRSRTFETVLAIIQKNHIQKNPIQRTESRAGHRFELLCSAIRAAFIFICLAVLIFYRKMYPFKENNLTRSFCFQIDEASTQGNELTLRGFAFGYNHRPVPPRLVLRPTKTGNEGDMDVNLRQSETEDTIVLDVKYGAARPDVNEYFLCDYDYTNVGFTATGIDNPETEYEIMIGWPLSKPVSTGVYILGEDVHRVAYKERYDEGLIETKKEKSPNDTGEESLFETHNKEGLNVATEKEHFINTEKESLRETTEKERPSDTDEKKIIFGTTSEENLAGSGGFEIPDLQTDFIKNGTLLVCRPDMHIWIFQYDGSLYWVADEGFHFKDDGMTYIQYHLWTTQIEKLPPGRLAQNYFWNDLSGYFENYEIPGDFGKYRVMWCELPTEYSITSILAGYYEDGDWAWANSFRPVYDF